MAVLTYYRLLKLHVQSGGVLTPNETSFLDQIDNANLTTLKSHSIFLAGLGDTKFPSGRELYFRFLKPTTVSGTVELGDREFEIPGYFGPIELCTHPRDPCTT